MFLSFSVASDIIGLCLCFHLRRSIYYRWCHGWTLLGPPHCGWSSTFFSLPSSELIDQHSAISILQMWTTSDGAEAVDGRLPLLRGLHLPPHQRPRRPGEVEQLTISKRRQPCNKQQSQTARHLGLCYIAALLTTGLAQQRYAFMNMSIIRWKTSCAPPP